MNVNRLADPKRQGLAHYPGQFLRFFLALHYALMLGLDGADTSRGILEDGGDFHQMAAEISGQARDSAKTINLGVMYGMGRKTLERTLTKLSGSKSFQANRVLSLYHERLPWVKDLQRTMHEIAKKKGYISTWSGRRRRYLEWEDGPWGRTRKYAHNALNALCQGTAADMTKKAILDVHAQLGKVPLLQVHDELCFSVESEEETQELARIMGQALPLRVSQPVDIHIGTTWAG